MAIANSIDLTTVTRLYTAFFNRAPDTAGLSFWANALANGASISTVTQGFLTAPEGVSQYPAFQSAEQFVSAFYAKVFGRAADTEGLAFWTAALNNMGGAESTAAKAALASQIISVVSTPMAAPQSNAEANSSDYQQAAADRALFANKVEIGSYLAVNSAVSIDQAKLVFSGQYPAPVSTLTPISDRIATVDLAKAALFNDQITTTTNNIVGTDSSDAFVINDWTDFGARTIKGGKGVDTLYLNSSAVTPADNQVSDIEIIRLEGASGTLDASKFLGSTSIGVSGVSGLQLNGMAGKTLALSHASLASRSVVTADYGDTATTAAINMEGGGGIFVPDVVTLAGSKLTSATVSGKGFVAVSGPAASLTTVNISADLTGTLYVSVASTVTTIDASTSKGGVGIVVDANQSYKGGSGIDVVFLSETPAKAIDGGAGENVLVVNGPATQVVLNAGITGFDTLRFGDSAVGEYDVGNFKHLRAENTVAGALIANKVAAGTDVTMSVSLGVNLTYNLANNAGTSDAVALTLTNANAFDAGTFTAAGVETVNITNTDSNETANGSANKLILTVAAAKSIVVTGNTGLELTATGSTAVTSFDASGLTIGSATDAGVSYASLNNTFGANVTIKGALTGVNILRGGDVTNDTIIGGAGNDVIFGSAGKDVLTGGAGDDTFVLALNQAAVTGGSSQNFTTITDATKGDTLNLRFLSTSGGFTANTLNHVTSVETATYKDFLALATGGDGTAAGAIASWFQVGGDTYIVVDNAEEAIFIEGKDQVVKLTGLVDVPTLTVELSVVP